MKQGYIPFFPKKVFTLLAAFVALFFSLNTLKAQVINEGFEESIWNNFTIGNASGSTSGQVVITATSANSTMSYMTLAGSSNYTTAVNTCPNSGTWWYSKATTKSSTKLGSGAHSIANGFDLKSGGYIITPITPAAVVSVTFWAAGSSPIVAGIATDPTNVGQPTYSNGNPAPSAFSYGAQTINIANATMNSYSFTGSYSGACRIGFFNNSGSDILIDDITVYAPVGTPPVVTTTTAVPGITNAQVSGTVTPGTLPLLASGIIWSTTNNFGGTISDTLKPKTKNIPSATGTFTNAASPLTPNTNYWTEAYVIGLDGTFFPGNVITFKTNNISVPAVTTNPANPISGYKATSGGVIVDSGGVAIIANGVAWSTTPSGETITSGTNFTSDGIGNPSFSSILKILTPSTPYYAKAYATNSLGTTFGNEITFITAAAVPSLVATPTTLSFGSVSYNTTSPVFSYTLNGYSLSSTGSPIVVTAPTGYTLSLSNTGGFASSLNIPYTGNTLSTTTVYVKLSTASYGTFSGNILHSGGGASNPNIDTVVVNGTIVQNPEVLTNMGTDFWVGYGYEEKMTSKIGTPAAYGLQLYVATGTQSANITVSIPGIASFTPLTYNIPANSVQIVTGIPTGDPNDATNASGMADARLYYTGISKRGINVSSTNGVPVAVFLYDYATNNSAGGSMVFPTNTWNSSYIVQATGGNSNTGTPNSFFFVIANQDNTQVTFTPSKNIIDSLSSPVINNTTTTLYTANTPYTITLNAGQVFNALGVVSGGVGVDLTGTTVSTTCDKKIAVFGGNGRCLIGNSTCTPSSGSDNLIQQMFPKVAWGTYYLTVPTKTMENNVYRVFVSDPATNVWLNVPTTTVHNASNALPSSSLTAAGTGGYYQFTSNQPSKIESNKPVTVTQFIVSGGCASSGSSSSVGNNGSGDPEMILLSPVQQAVNNTTVYSSDFKNGASGGTYINVVIPHAGVSTFSLDGITAAVDTGASSYTANSYGSAPLINMVNAFTPYTLDTSYYWAKFHVSYPATHRLASSIPFNAIAYGVANGESWGYNAGTTLNNLTTVATTQTPFGTATSPTTCIGNPTNIKVSVPYDASTITSIKWSVSNNSNISPNYDTTVNNPISTGTYTVSNSVYTTYASPLNYTFANAGSYLITLTLSGTFQSDCGSSTTIKFYMTVVKDTADFSFTPASCGSLNINFKDSSHMSLGDTAKQWIWDFGEPSSPSNTSTVNPTSHIYGSHSIYNVHLRIINNIGCYADTTKVVDLSGGMAAHIASAPDTICFGKGVTFTSNSTSSQGTITQCHWHFSDGSLDTITTNNTPFVHTFLSSGYFTVTMYCNTALGCTSNTDTVHILVAPNPHADFIPPAGVCIPGSTQFTNATTISDTTLPTVTYLWNFGDATANSTATNPAHPYTTGGPFTVKLIATSKFGCIDSISKTLTNVYPQPTASFNINYTPSCSNDSVRFVDVSTSNNSSSIISKWAWAFGDSGTDTVQNPSHKYANATGSPYTVSLIVTTDKGCVSNAVTHPMTINLSPKVVFNPFIHGICLNASPKTLQATETTGQSGSYTFSGTGVSQSGGVWYFNPSGVTPPDSIPIKVIFSVAGSGCIDTATQKIAVWPLPVVKWGYTMPDCETRSIQFTDSSTTSVGQIKAWSWNFGDASANSTVQNPLHTYAAWNTYPVTLKATTDSGCVVTSTPINVTVHSIPHVSFTMPATGVCLPNAKATFNSTTTNADGGSMSYLWNFGDPADPTPATTPNATHTYTTYNIPFTVTLKVISNGCDSTYSQQFSNIYPQPTAAFSALPTEICLGDSIHFTSTGSGNLVKWYWNFGESLSIDSSGPLVWHAYATANTFTTTLAVVNSNGCVSDPATLPVIIHSLPVVDAGPDVYILQGHTGNLKATGNGSLTYLWTPNTYLNYDTLLNPSCTPLTDQFYTLKVTDGFGCINTDNMTVYLLKEPIIPNVFSPNGDGINDTWVITYLNFYAGATVDVFDRNGQNVFHTYGYGQPWDGTFKGKPLPIETYYYIIDPKNQHPVISGSITILR